MRARCSKEESWCAW